MFLEHVFQGLRFGPHDLDRDAITVLCVPQDRLRLLGKHPCIQSKDADTGIDPHEHVRDHLVFGSETCGESDLGPLESSECPGQRLGSGIPLDLRLQ